MAAYNVEPRNRKANKRGQWWVVITPEKRVANNHWHTTEKSADHHCGILNAYFGDKS